MILTFPIFMAYNSQYNMINEDIDLSCMLSLIKVRMPDKSVYEKGIETLTEIVKNVRISFYLIQMRYDL